MNQRTSTAITVRDDRPSTRDRAPWYQRAASAVSGWFRGLGRSQTIVRGVGGYEGAVQSRRTDGWLASNLSANAQIQRGGSLLRARSRDLVRNNPHAAKAISALVSNAVGTGIRPMSSTGDAATDKAVDDLFARWSCECQGDGVLDFFGLQALAFRGMLESGGSLTRRRLRRMADGLPVPLQLQLLEIDFLDQGQNGALPDGSRRVQGVEFDDSDRLNAYWLFRNHPGESVISMDGRRGISSSAPVDAADVAHLFEPQRPGQVRGVPWLTPVLRLLRDLDDYGDAERFRKKLESCVVAFVMSDDESQDGLGPSVTDSAGEVLEQLEPGLIALVRGGKDVRMSTPASVGGFGEYNRTELQKAATGARMTYEILAGDLSQVNFSSIRAGLVEFRRMIRGLQQHLVIPMWCRPVWGWFIEAAIASGELPERAGGYPVKWIPPAFESIDRLKDALADKAELRSGLSSLPEVVARRGGDFEAHVDEIHRSNEAIDAAGLVLDSDARRVSNAGIGQGEEPGTVEDE